jgi:hypothetical protein
LRINQFFYIRLCLIDDEALANRSRHHKQAIIVVLYSLVKMIRISPKVIILVWKSFVQAMEFIALLLHKTTDTREKRTVALHISPKYHEPMRTN